MTVQHGLKVVVFGVLGFAFGPWIALIAAMVTAGVLGTITGRVLLERLTDHGFKSVLSVALSLIALRLIWLGIAAF